MNISPLVEHLRSSLPGSSLAFVVSALRQEPTIWESLKDPDLWQRICAEPRTDPDDWSPASLGLLALQVEEAKALQPAALRSDLQFPLESGLHRQAAKAFESLTTGQVSREQECDVRQAERDMMASHAPASLAHSALLALALREHRRLSGSWNELGDELNKRASGKPSDQDASSDRIFTAANDTFYLTWRTPLACLYGMVPDTFEMLRSLLTPDAPASRQALVIHILLSNPLPQEIIYNQLWALLSDVPLAEGIMLVDQLSLKRPEMASSLAIELLNIHRDLGLDTGDQQPNLPAQADYSAYLGRLDQLLLLARVNQLAVKPDQALPFLNAALETSNRLHAELVALLAQNAAQRGDATAALPALKQAVQIASDNPIYQAKLALAQFDENPQQTGSQQEDTPADLTREEDTPATQAHPAILLADTHIAAQKGDREKARRSAQAFLDLLEETPDYGKTNPAARFLVSRQGLADQSSLPGKDFTGLLLELDLPAGAATCANLVLQVQPDDPVMLALLAKAQAKTGNLSEAAEDLELALCLSPRQSDLHRQLAGYYESLGNFQAALQEYTNLLEGASDGVPTEDDLHKLSGCALQVGEPQAALQACQRILETNPEDGLAHSDLGRALFALGDVVQAEAHLTQATQLSPTMVKPWLELTHLQKAVGRTQQALETLRAGSQAAAESPDLYLEMGEAYLADWEGRGHPTPTQALTMFQHAYTLASSALANQTKDNGSMNHIALRLGQTLHQLGHTNEARRVLEPAYQEFPSYPGLAATYAQVMLALNQPQAAIPALKHVIDTQTEDHSALLQTYLDYGRALISIHEQPQEALRALRQVLEWDPSHPEARALLAEGLAACGEHSAAMESYQSAMETNLVEDPAWCSRLSLGLGKSALVLGHPEIAMASLEEAAQADPSNPQIQRTLAEAYEAGSLFSNALKAARITLRLDPNDVDTLAWFAGKVIRWTGSENGSQPDGSLGSAIAQVRIEAVNALNRAIQLNPQRTDLLVSLGKAQRLAGDPAAAAETFRKMVENDYVTCDDLHQSALCLLKMGDAASAVACLEHALHISQGKAFDASGPESLAFTLIEAYTAAGNPQAALATVEQALSFSYKDLSLLRCKARLLLDLGRLEDALKSLEAALEIEPHSEYTCDIHYQAALLLRALGNLPAALDHLEKVLASSDAKPLGSVHPASRVLAAELSYAMLQPDKARAFLGALPSPFTTETGDAHPTDNILTGVKADEIENLFNSYCLRAELSLDLNEELQIAEKATRSAKALVDHSTQPGIYRPRLLAIQSRILAHHGETDQALLALKQAMSQEEQSSEVLDSNYSFKKLERSFHSRTQSLASSTLELSQWESALYLWRQVTEQAPHEPLLHLYLAASLAMRAEAQRFCEDIELVNHTPGKAALDEHARLAFEKAIETASTCQPVDPNNPLIIRWRARGQAVFSPSVATAQALATMPIFPLNPEDVAAHIANLRSLNKTILPGQDTSTHTSSPSIVANPTTIAAQAARSYPQHPLVLAQLALALASRAEYIKEALTAAQAAVKTQLEKGSSCPPAGWLPQVQDGSQAVVANALLASIAFKAGEIELANQAIQIALAGWFDEPRWQALAANIQNARGDVDLMITHLQQATSLDPSNLDYFMALGEAYQVKAQNEIPETEVSPFIYAIQTFEKATDLAPDRTEPWMALARTHRQAKDLSHAASCAEQAIRLAPDQAQPLILRAEIALQAGDAQQAHDRAQAAIQMEDPSGPNPTDKFHEDVSTPVLLLARALLNLDRPGEALDVIEKALPNAQEPLPLLLERVQLLRRARSPEAANDALYELSQNYPDEPLVLAPMAKIMVDTNQTEAAIKLAQRSLQATAIQEPVRGAYLNLSTADKVEMHILLGRMLRQTGQLDQAIHHLNEAVHLDPHLLEPYLELGRTHQERRQLAQALQIYNEATNIAPKDPRPYFQAGIALKESKDYLGAENMLRRAAALAPNDLSIHRQLGAVVALNLVHNRRRTTIEL
jgi:tetratricopeptide (TPR) repeat protein